MMYPTVYRETMKDIRDGKYGAEMKRLANETELVTVDAEEKPYRCPDCGFIESTVCLDLYKPNDLEGARKVVIGRWTAGEPSLNDTVGSLGDWPYWTPGDYDNKEKGDYVLLKKYEHMCPVCKKIMEEFDLGHLDKYTCPKCGGKYEEVGGMLWD